MLLRIVFFLAIILPFQSLSSQIGAKIKEQRGICGIWSNHDFAFPMTLVLNSDGSAVFDGEPLKYRVEGMDIQQKF